MSKMDLKHLEATIFSISIFLINKPFFAPNSDIWNFGFVKCWAQELDFGTKIMTLFQIQQNLFKVFVVWECHVS